MLLPNSNIQTESIGVTASEAFKVGDAGVILEILRTKIYKDPIMAICREITCNARDAHREVGKPNRPIVIELPSLWNSGQVRIQDFGPGISPDRMSEIFIAFGNSTKRSDNIQTGGFGLGAKTPFAYTDSFTVVTVVDGLKYTYTAYIDETRVGRMDLMGKPVATDEENGTTIVIGISRNDVDTFSRYMLECTKHWEVKPIFKGLDTRYTYPNMDILYEGTSWAFPKNNSSNRYRYDKQSFAIVDGIEYKIDPSSIQGLESIERSILNTGFYLYFNVGDLVLAASRDNLHYEGVTNKKIKAQLKVLKDEIVTLVQGKISNATSYTEAVNQYCQVKDVFNQAGLMDAISNIKWQGHEIITLLPFTTLGKWTTLQNYRWDNYKKRVVKTSVNDIDFLNDECVIYLHDIKNKHVPGYLIHHLMEVENQHRIQVVAMHDVPHNSDYQNEVRYAQAMGKDLPVVTYEKKWVDLLGFKSLQKALDSMPKAAKNKSKRTGKLKEEDNHILGYKLSCNQSSLIVSPGSFDPEKNGYYFQIDVKTKVLSSEDVTISQNLTTHYLTAAQKLLDGPVVAFSEARVKQINRHKFDAWKPALKPLKEKIEKMDAQYDWAAYNEAVKSYHYHWEFWSEKFNCISSKMDRLDPNSPLVKWFRKSEQVAEVINSDVEFRDMAVSILNKKVTYPCMHYSLNTDINSECKTLYNQVKKRYPLLMKIDAYNQDVNAIVQYINLIDNYKP